MNQLKDISKYQVGTKGIYILGVKEHFRGDELVRRLNSFGLSSTIIWGPQASIDVDLISRNTNQKFANFAIKRDILPEEVACSLGHLRMYSKFIQSNQMWGLFLEDDAICIENPSMLLNRLPITDTPCHIFLHDGGGTNLNIRSPRNNLLHEMGMIKRLDPQYGAYGYLLNRRAAELILKSKAVSLLQTADWPYLWPREIEFYQSKIIYFTHPEDLSQSLIGNRTNAEAKLISQLPNFLRIFIGIRLGIGARQVIHREVILKLQRISLQIKRKIWSHL